MRSSLSFFAVLFLCTSSVLASELLRTHRFGNPNDSHEGAWAGHIEYAAWLDDDTFVALSKSGTLTCRSLKAEKLLWEVKQLGDVRGFSVSRKTRRIAITPGSLSLQVLDADTGKFVFRTDHTQLAKLLGVDFPLLTIARLTPDDGRLVITLYTQKFDRQAFVLDPTFSRVDSSFSIDACISSLSISPDAATATTLADEKVLCVREIKTDREIYFAGKRILKEPENGVSSGAVDAPFMSDARHDGKHTLVYTVDNSWGTGRAYVMNLTEKQTTTFDARNGHIVMDVDFAKRRIALTGTEAGLTVVDFSGKEIAHLPKATLQRNMAVEFSPSGNQILVGSWDNTVSVFTLKK